MADELVRQSTRHRLYHFDMHTKYEDYLFSLARLEYMNAVLDRYFLCEFVYAPLKGRKIQFTAKESQNLLALTLIQRPVVVLGTAIPPKSEYSKEEYLEHDKLKVALGAYVSLLRTLRIQYLEYDYRAMSAALFAKRLLTIEDGYLGLCNWWVPMWTKGYGCVGSPDPKVLIMAERLGPFNYRNIPFEAGPTGLMMQELMAGAPVRDYALTNWVKTGDAAKDALLLEEELSALNPKFVVVMGSVAKKGIPVLDKLGVPYRHVVHLGFINRNRAMWDRYKESFWNMWQEVTGESIRV